MFQRISIEQAHEIIEQKDPVIFDIRDEHSFAQSHINGAKHVKPQSLADACSEVSLEQAIIVYCYHGNSSQMLAHYLSDVGFTQVFSMDGGFEAWKNKY